MKVAIVGFGKVGYHLSKAFLSAKIDVTAIYNRSEITRPRFIPDSLPLLVSLDNIPKESDIVILSISDDQISKVADHLPSHIKENAIIAHTSGIHGINVYNESIQNKAAFYPLNTFSKEGTIDWQETPVFITSEKMEHTMSLSMIAKSINSKVYEVDDEQKAVLHTAAVFVNNFTNVLFQMGHHILKDNEMAFEALIPLIRNTFEKIKTMSPKEAQTGPALRGDIQTIRKHYEILEAYPFEKQVYQLLSHYINPKLQEDNEND